MAVTLCVLLWSVPGNEDLLVEYEDLVLARLSAHGGRVLQRVRRNETSVSPYEVQTLVFASQEAMDSFMVDPERLALADMRAQCVAQTEIIPVDLVDG